MPLLSPFTPVYTVLEFSWDWKLTVLYVINGPNNLLPYTNICKSKRYHPLSTIVPTSDYG